MAALSVGLVAYNDVAADQVEEHQRHDAMCDALYDPLPTSADFSTTGPYVWEVCRPRRIRAGSPGSILPDGRVGGSRYVLHVRESPWWPRVGDGEQGGPSFTDRMVRADRYVHSLICAAFAFGNPSPEKEVWIHSSSFDDSGPVTVCGAAGQRTWQSLPRDLLMKRAVPAEGVPPPRTDD